MVESPVAPNRLSDTEGNRYQKGEGGGDADEDEVVRQLGGDERVDALIKAVGVAEVAVKHMGEEGQVLRDERTVETVRPVESSYLACARPLAEDGTGEVAGDDVLEHEHEHR